MNRASYKFRFWSGLLSLAITLTASSAAIGFDTFGNGYGSKWGDDPTAGTGAVVSWGYMADGTDVDPNFRIDPFEHPDISGVVGTSNITQLRSPVDANFGLGAFDGAIQRAFDTWSNVANITFVGPLADSGLPVDSAGAISPMIRIGAFLPDPNHWFKGTSAVGFGPPGPSGPAFFPLSGDVLFNLNGIGSVTSYQIANGREDIDAVPNVYQFGDDVEGLFLHELGHAAIGLGHPYWAGENPDQRVMYTGDWSNENAPYCCQTLNQELHPDDIAAAQYVYGIRGDFNRDGRVDAADYTVWRDGLGSSVTSGTEADGNVDGIVNVLDYDVWKSHFGEVALTGFGEQTPNFGAAAFSSTVPEPSGLALLLTIVAMSALYDFKSRMA